MSIRMPISIGSRKGLSKVVATAEKERVLLTSHGRVVAVVDSAERIDDDMRRLREAADEVIGFATRDAVGNVKKRWDLESACDRLGLDGAVVSARARVPGKT